MFCRRYSLQRQRNGGSEEWKNFPKFSQLEQDPTEAGLESMLLSQLQQSHFFLGREDLGTGKTTALWGPRFRPEPCSLRLSDAGFAFPGTECAALLFKSGDLLALWPHSNCSADLVSPQVPL